ncbi:MAG: DUF938 domain-containing protein [Myxococcota bacterium]
MRLHAPAAERNAAPILERLRTLLPASGTVLEVASGTGQHVATFAAALPKLTFVPSEPDPDKHDSIRAWTEGLGNVEPPRGLDVTAQPWPVDAVDAIFCANMIHIAPSEATTGLLRGAGQILTPGSMLVLYGPFRVGGQHTASSNAAFDASLQARDPRWGVRDLDAVTAEAATFGLEPGSVIEMPANNKIVTFVRRSTEG